MLDVKEVAKLLTVSEKTIYRWITKNEIPAYKVGQTYRFNRVELLEWATAKRVRVSHEIFAETVDPGEPLPSLRECIDEGGIHYRIAGDDREGVLRAIVGIMRLPEDVDREFLLGALLARENLGTTAIGDGIAIPHVRNPIIFHVTKPIVALCFLEEPIDFDALDGKPVDTVFAIITNTVRSHLHVLSRLSFALHQPEVRRSIVPASTRQEIMDALGTFEASLNDASLRK